MTATMYGALDKLAKAGDTATGTIIFAATTPMALPAGIAGHILTSDASGNITLQAPPAGFTNPMTTLGDLIYENATPAAARLAGNTTATRKFLRQTGTGSVSAAPAWDTIAAGDLPAGTTSTQGALQLDGTTGDIAASPGTAAAGSTGKAADAGHAHPQPSNFAPTGLTGATSASRYVGATTSGAPASGTFAVGDYTVDRTGSFWICTAAGTPGTWIQVIAGSVVGGVPVLDSTASDFQPDGIQAAGSTGKAADAGHVHPEKANQSLLLAHSGAIAETFPRYLASTNSSALVTGTVYCAAMALPKGAVVANLTAVGGSGGESGGTHCWMALLDSTLTVLAVSADNTGATFFTGNTAHTLAMGAAYTTTAAGLYYVALSITATSMPNLTALVLTSLNGVNAVAGPILYGTAGTQNAPPAVSAQLNSGTLAAAVLGAFYAYAS